MCGVYGGFWISSKIEYSLIDLSLAGAGVAIPYHTIPCHTCQACHMQYLAYLLYLPYAYLHTCCTCHVHTCILAVPYFNSGSLYRHTRRCCKVNQDPAAFPETFHFCPSAIPQRTPRPSPMPTTNWLLWLFVPFSTRFTNQMLFVNPLHPSCWTWPFPFVRPHVIRPVLKRPYLSGHTCDSGRRSKKAVSRFCTRRSWHWVGCNFLLWTFWR